VVEFVSGYCPIDDNLAENIVKCLDSSGRLTYRLFCRFALAPKATSIREDHSRPTYSLAMVKLSNFNIDGPVTHSPVHRDKLDNIYLSQLIDIERSSSAQKAGNIIRGPRLEEFHK
jgi:hypothetical protein